MTLTTNARVAGFTYLFYIAVGLAAMFLFGKASSGQGIAANLASIAQHATAVRVSVILSLLGCFSALVLSVTMYSMTREQDPDLALLAMTCRIGEGVFGAVSTWATLALLWLATAAGAAVPKTEVAQALGEFLLNGPGWLFGAIFFAGGSTLFSYLLLRGRIIPVPLAWVGVLASVLILVGLPLQLAGFLQGPVTFLLWLPMLAFEVPLGLWLLIKGAARPAPR